MYSTVLFDLDGTLTDPGEGITNSVAYALSKWNIDVKERSELYKFIGPPLAESFSRYYGFSESDAVRAVEAYREYFRARGIYENKLYPDTEKMLRALKEAGKKLVLATSKPEVFAKEILRYFSIDGYFDHVAGATLDGNISEKADVIAYALELSSTDDLNGTIMIGDRKHDILGANVNGVDSIGVLYGYGSRDELEAAGASYIASSIDDILKIIV